VKEVEKGTKMNSLDEVESPREVKKSPLKKQKDKEGAGRFDGAIGQYNCVEAE